MRTFTLFFWQFFWKQLCTNSTYSKSNSMTTCKATLAKWLRLCKVLCNSVWYRMTKLQQLKVHVARSQCDSNSHLLFSPHLILMWSYEIMIIFLSFLSFFSATGVESKRPPSLWVNWACGWFSPKLESRSSGSWCLVENSWVQSSTCLREGQP